MGDTVLAIDQVYRVATLGLIYEKSLTAFLLITVLLGGSGAFMIGRAMAKGWKPLWQGLVYTLLLGAVVRFLHWGLFLGATLLSWREAQGDLFSPHYYVIDTAILTLFTALGFRIQRTSQMARQYGFTIEKSSPISWRSRKDSSVNI